MRKVLQEVYAPTKGLDYRIPDTQKDVRYASDIQNCRITDGQVRKDWGYTAYGTNQPLLGVPCKLSVYKQYDGTLRPMCFTTKYIYDYETASDRWNVIGKGTVVEDCEDIWYALKLPAPFTHIKCNDDAGNTTVTDDGSGSNACTSSTNTSNLSVTGKVNDGFEFTAASTETIDIDSVAADIKTDATGSLVFWVKPDAITGTTNNIVFSLGDTDAAVYAYFRTVDDSMRFAIDAGSGNSASWIVATSVTTDWTHWAFVQNGTALVIYKNGVDVTPTPSLAGTGTAGKWFSFASGVDNGRMGCFNVNSAGDATFMDGLVDDLRYYQTTVLTQPEVQVIYNADSGTETSQPEISASDDVTVTVSTDEVRGTYSVKTVIDATFTTGVAAYEDLSSVDLSGSDYLHFWIKASRATSATELDIRISEATAGGTGSDYEDVSIPALVADTWTEVEVAFAEATTKRDNVDSVALIVASDQGAVDIYLDDIRGQDRYTGDQNDGWNACMHNGQYFAVNYDDAIQRHNEAVVFDDMAGASSYKAKDIVSYHGHLVLLNTYESATENPHRVRWTISGTLAYASADWTGTGSGFIDLLDTSGHIVKGLKLGDDLIVYKEDSIFAISWIGGSTVFRRDLRVTNLGLLSQRGVVRYKGKHYFIGTDHNIYEYSGEQEPTSFGDPIAPYISSQIAPDNEDRSILILDEDYDELLVGIPTGTETQPNVFFRYNFKEKTWTKSLRNFICVGTHQKYTAITYGTALGTYAQQTLKYGETSSKSTAKIILVADVSGYIYKIDRLTLNLNGSAQTAFWDSVDFTFRGSKDNSSSDYVEYIQDLKRILKFLVEAKGGKIDIRYSVDQGTGWELPVDTNSHTLTPHYSLKQTDVDLGEKMIRVRFYNETVTSEMNFRWFGIEYLVDSKDYSGS